MRRGREEPTDPTDRASERASARGVTVASSSLLLLLPHRPGTEGKNKPSFPSSTTASHVVGRLVGHLPSSVCTHTCSARPVLRPGAGLKHGVDCRALAADVRLSAVVGRSPVGWRDPPLCGSTRRRLCSRSTCRVRACGGKSERSRPRERERESMGRERERRDGTGALRTTSVETAAIHRSIHRSPEDALVNTFCSLSTPPSVATQRRIDATRLPTTAADLL
jgi:hypothetical protein